MPDLQDELSRLESRLDPARRSVIDELANVRADLACAPDRKGPLRLANVRIASPCKERWADMIGDKRVRVCSGCDRPVFNLSAMSSEQAEAVLATRGVTPCVRFFRRADGKVMTADCPPGARRKVRIAAVAAGAFLFGASPAMANPAPDPAAVVQDGTTGAIQGIVHDSDTGEALIGVTVVVTSPSGEQQTAITDENGVYKVTSLPLGSGYVVAFYYADISVEQKSVTVGANKTTPIYEKLKTSAAGGETIVVMGGVPTIDPTIDGYQEEEGILAPFEPAHSAVEQEDDIRAPAPEPEPEHRPVIEWSSWARVGIGIKSRASAGVARSTIPPSPLPERHTTVETALGADLTLPIALHGDLRFGAWTEVRTSSGPVLGGELQLQMVPHWIDQFGWDGGGVLSIRTGGNAHVVTGAVAYGYLAPWNLWGSEDGKTRYMIGTRLVAAVTRSIDDPRDWTATAGLEFEPVGAVRYLLGIDSWY